jgi:3-deoxy-7-phosphoheptulonate synthase
MVFSQPLPSPLTLKNRLPLSIEGERRIRGFRKQAQSLLKNPQQLVLIIGPCSIHHPDSMLSYAQKLKELSQHIAPTCFIVMRAYPEKPRTTLGWKGFLYQPQPAQRADLAEGLFLTRKLFLELTVLGIPLCMEFVDPLSACYFDDLMTWGTIGARTSASQTHRQIASCLSFPIGFKNTIDGNIDVPIQAMITAGTQQTFFGISQEGLLSSMTSKGNPWTHLILRGSEEKTNYDLTSVESIAVKQQLYKIQTPILIDCSHGNSKKNLAKQKEVFLEVLDQKLQRTTPLLGMMLESFLKEGHQEVLPDKPIDQELSITDPCIGWESTEELLLWAHTALSEQSSKTLHSFATSSFSS